MGTLYFLWLRANLGPNAERAGENKWTFVVSLRGKIKYFKIIEHLREIYQVVSTKTFPKFL